VRVFIVSNYPGVKAQKCRKKYNHHDNSHLLKVCFTSQCDTESQAKVCENKRKYNEDIQSEENENQ